MFYLGIDVSKKTARYFILNESGNKLKAFTLLNNKESLKGLHQSLSSDNILAGIEATGSFWENTYSFLKDRGFHIVLKELCLLRKGKGCKGNYLKDASWAY